MQRSCTIPRVGTKSGILPYKTYREAMAYLEDLDDLQAMKEVEDAKPIPWEEVKRRLMKRTEE
jgi:hypothetical protein